MEIYKNPQLYKSLGELAIALGGKNSVGTKLGTFGMQESENWAAREAQKKAEEEAKKKKNAGIGGSIGSTVGGIGGFMLGGPAGAAAGAALGSGAGQGIGGGGTDYIDMGKVATDAAMSGVTSFGAQALMPATATAQGAAQGGTQAAVNGAVPPLVDGASVGGAAGAARAADFAAATGSAATKTAGAVPALAAGAPIVDAVPAGSAAPQTLALTNAFTKMGLSPKNAAAGQAFVDASGGWSSMVQPLVNAANAPLDIADSLEPYPGLSPEGLSALKQDARANEQVHDQRANMALDNQVAQQRLALDKQQMAISEKRAEAALNEPVAVKQVDPSTGIETTQYVPKSALTSAQPLITGAPKPQGMLNVAPGNVVFDTKTQNKVFENPKAPADPKFHALSEGQILTDEQGNIIARGNAKTQKPQGMMNVAPGGAVFDPKTQSKVFENPKAPTAPKFHALSEGQVLTDEQGNVVAHGNPKTEKPVLVDVFDNINGNVVQRKEVWTPGQPVPQGTASLNDIANAKHIASGSGGPQTAPSFNNLQTAQRAVFAQLISPWADVDPMTGDLLNVKSSDIGVVKSQIARTTAFMQLAYTSAHQLLTPIPVPQSDGTTKIFFQDDQGNIREAPGDPIILPQAPNTGSNK